MKFQDYQANGVQEYWIVDASTNVLEQYLLVDGQYEKQKYNQPKQKVRSIVIKGFEVPLAALFDAEKNLTTLPTL